MLDQAPEETGVAVGVALRSSLPASHRQWLVTCRQLPGLKKDRQHAADPGNPDWQASRLGCGPQAFLEPMAATVEVGIGRMLFELGKCG